VQVETEPTYLPELVRMAHAHVRQLVLRRVPKLRNAR
jgi:hypothetical protein